MLQAGRHELSWPPVPIQRDQHIKGPVHFPPWIPRDVHVHEQAPEHLVRGRRLLLQRANEQRGVQACFVMLRNHHVGQAAGGSHVLRKQPMVPLVSVNVDAVVHLRQRFSASVDDALRILRSMGGNLRECVQDSALRMGAEFGVRKRVERPRVQQELPGAPRQSHRDKLIRAEELSELLHYACHDREESQSPLDARLQSPESLQADGASPQQDCTQEDRLHAASTGVAPPNALHDDRGDDGLDKRCWGNPVLVRAPRAFAFAHHVVQEATHGKLI
mmetsp:Transcript_33260/g.105169  ORF Transcript_33260/g.105169 Transcript_33260/m.105169 type:complete len:275 (-) Transcript_33260:2046-2870(-)